MEIEKEKAESMLAGISLADIKKVTDNPELISYCCMAGRIGLSAFMIELEYLHFKPGTPLNEDLSLAMMKWPDDAPLMWAVLTIPKSYKELADEIAAKHMLSVKEAGMGFLVIGGPKGSQEFPITGPNIYMMEGARGSAEYMPFEEKKAARAKEEAFCQAIMDEHDKWLETPEGQAAPETLNPGDYTQRGA